MDANRNCLTIGLVARHSFHVDSPFLSVHLGDFSFAIVIMAAYNHDLVISANGHGAHGVLSSQILTQRRRHQFPSYVRWGSKVRLARLAARAADSCLLLHAWSALVKSTNVYA